MSIVKFECYKCKNKLRQDDKHAGRKGRCPKCGAKNTIPYPGQDELLTSVTKLLDECDSSDFGDWMTNNE